MISELKQAYLSIHEVFGIFVMLYFCYVGRNFIKNTLVSTGDYF